jgi:hypothetical protein
MALPKAHVSDKDAAAHGRPLLIQIVGPFSSRLSRYTGLLPSQHGESEIA